MRLRVILPVIVVVIAVLAYTLMRVSRQNVQVHEDDSGPEFSEEIRIADPSDYDQSVPGVATSGSANEPSAPEMAGRNGRKLDPEFEAVPSKVPSEDVFETGKLATDMDRDVEGSGAIFIAPEPGNSGLEYIAPEPGNSGLEYIVPEPGNTGLEYIAPEPGNTGLEYTAPEPGNTGLDYIAPEPGNTGLDYVVPEPDDSALDYSVPETDGN